MTGALFALTLLAALGSGVVAGIWFTFSVFVMAALGRLPPDQGIAAMQSINVSVLNPWFFSAFFGTAAVCLLAAILSLFNWSDRGAVWLLAGTVLYLLGSIGVTMAFNVPLNRALAAANPDSAEGAQVWGHYLSAWTAWNHVRMAGSVAAAASFMMALRG